MKTWAVPQRVLYTFVRLQARALSLIIEAVRHGDCNEEEDFATFAYQLPLDPHDASQHDESLLRQAAELADSLQSNADAAADHLAEHLRFRRAWLQLHVGLARTPAGMEATRRLLSIVHERLAALRAVSARTPTEHFALPPNCMEPHIVKRLAFPAPPRPITVFTWPDALRKLELLSAHIGRALEVPIQSPSCTLRSLRDFFAHFATLGADAIPRARLHLLWQAGAPPKKVLGNVLLPELVRDDMLVAGLPRGVVDQAAASNEFLEKGAIVMVHLFRAYCFNQSRRHRKLARVFHEFEVLQVNTHP